MAGKFKPVRIALAASRNGQFACHSSTLPRAVSPVMNDHAASMEGLLESASRGEDAAVDRLTRVVNEEMRRLAAHLMAPASPGLAVQPTALVHEVYVRLLGTGEESWERRAAFYRAAASAVRGILVDRARRAGEEDLPALDEALRTLSNRNARLHEVVMLRHFAGLSDEQTALAMDVPVETVRRDWAFARAWLMRQIAAGRGASDPGGSRAA